MRGRLRLLIVDEAIIAGGVETLRRELIPELAARVESLVWVLPDHVIGSYQALQKAHPALHLEGLPPRRGSWMQWKTALLRRLRSRKESAWLSERLQSLRDARIRQLAAAHLSHVYLTTCVFQQPFPRVDLPVAGMISDLNPALPEPIRKNILHWVDNASMTFAVSDFTAGELCRSKPGRSARIFTVPLAPPSPRSSPVPRGVASGAAFFYPAAPNLHKGHLTLLSAVHLLALRGLDFRVVLTGPGLGKVTSGNAPANSVVKEITEYLGTHSATVGKHVEIQGDVSQDHVKSLFASASCVVLPSSYEGFGLPLVEALRFGKQIICSDIPAFREQVVRYRCEDLVTLFPAGDIHALAQAMARHISTPTTRPQPTPPIEERLACWTWGDAAQKIVDHLAQLRLP